MGTARQVGGTRPTTSVSTYEATIYVGTKVRATGEIVPLDALRGVCQQYVDRIGLCVSFTPTEFIYTDGSEPGAIVGLINYPRFPANPIEIRDDALALANDLLVAAQQLRVSVVLPDETVMLSEWGIE